MVPRQRRQDCQVRDPERWISGSGIRRLAPQTQRPRAATDAARARTQSMHGPPSAMAKMSAGSPQTGQRWMFMTPTVANTPTHGKAVAFTTALWGTDDRAGSFDEGPRGLCGRGSPGPGLLDESGEDVRLVDARDPTAARIPVRAAIEMGEAAVGLLESTTARGADDGCAATIADGAQGDGRAIGEGGALVEHHGCSSLSGTGSLGL